MYFTACWSHCVNNNSIAYFYRLLRGTVFRVVHCFLHQTTLSKPAIRQHRYSSTARTNWMWSSQNLTTLQNLALLIHQEDQFWRVLHPPPSQLLLLQWSVCSASIYRYSSRYKVSWCVEQSSILNRILIEYTLLCSKHKEFKKLQLEKLYKTNNWYRNESATHVSWSEFITKMGWSIHFLIFIHDSGVLTQ
jgi:hypothetical protein